MDIKNSKIKITTNFEKFIENLETILEADSPISISHLDFDQAKINLRNLYDSITEYQNIKLQNSNNIFIPQNNHNEDIISNKKSESIETQDLSENNIEPTEEKIIENVSAEPETQLNLSLNNETQTEILSPEIDVIDELPTNLNVIEDSKIEIPELEFEPEQKLIATPEPLNEQIDTKKIDIEDLNIAEKEIEQEIIAEKAVIEEEKITTPTQPIIANEPLKAEVVEISDEIIETEIPKILSDKFSNSNSSVYDRLKNNKEDLSLGKKLQNQPLSDLRKAIGINDRFSFINELFEGKKDEFDTFLNRVIEIDELKKLNILIDETSATKNWSSKTSFNKFSSILSRYIQSK